MEEAGSASAAANTNNILLEQRFRLLEFQTDLEADPTSNVPRNRRQRHAMAEQVLKVVGDWLDQADRGIDHLLDDSSSNDQDNGLLGSAIVRGCQELADAVGHVAEQLEEHSNDPERRRALAEACYEDFNSGLRLLEPEEEAQQQLLTHSKDESDITAESALLATPEVVGLDDFSTALKAAVELLRDVEVALRGMEKDEADDLADAALGVAHLFVLSCRQLHAQVTPQELVDCMEDFNNNIARESPQIELLSEDNHDDDRATAPSSFRNNNNQQHSKKQKQPERLRCIWPPVGPAVGQALQWTKHELEQQHWLLSVALALTLWPAAVITAVIGTPAVLADHCLQTAYQHFQNTPLLTAAEVAAAQVYQTSRLALLTGRAVARPTWRVAHRQWQRHGATVQDWAHHKLTHPVDTVQETVGGVLWCTGQLVEMVQQHVLPKFHEVCHPEEDSDSESVVAFDRQPRLEEMLSL